jgi:phosphoglucosamine mutase
VSLVGLRVVVDCANGAASALSPQVLRAAGADVVAIHASPDGLNINDNCGSTHLGALKEAVREHAADVGIAHDGDADRCLAVDATGSEVDGDHILAILAKALADSGRLPSRTVVATVMANLGFKKAMQAADIAVVEPGVGARYVLEAMRAQGLVLGGEQSGHIVMLDHATTGDGLLTALQLLAQMARTGRTLAELAAAVTKFPQVLINVRDVDRDALASSVDVRMAVLQAQEELADSGRVLLRPSGTEPVIRVMVEAATIEQAEQIGEALARIVQTAIPNS